MTIDLDPNISLGPITLAWHGIFTAVGIFFGVWLPVRLLRGRVREDDAYAVATWGVVGGIVGARLVHVVDCWSACGYDTEPLRILQIWVGGIAIWGAGLGGVIGGYIAALRRGFPIGLGADAAAPGIALGFAIGRIGDIINGEHHAIPCDGGPGLCVSYVNPATLGQGPAFSPVDPRFSPGPVHLAVGYDMIWSLIGMAGALWLRDRAAGRWSALRARTSLPPGVIFWLWWTWYAIGRFLQGFLRLGEPTYAFALREDQLIAVLVLAAAIPMLAHLRPRRPIPAPAA